MPEFRPAGAKMPNRARPLDNFPLIRTRSIEQARQVFSRIYTKPTLEPESRARAINIAMNNCQLQQVGLSYGTYGAAVRLGFPEADFFLQLFPIQGKGEIVISKATVPLAPDRSVTISSNMDYGANYGADYEHLVLRINAQTLTRKLAAMTGATISAPLVMDPAPDFARPTAQMLRDYFMLLVGELSAASSPLPDWALAETEQLMMVMFLCGNRHNYSHLLDQKPLDVAPWQIRRAEEYIEANWNQPISLEDLADITGLNTLSLFRSFKQSRGYSPMEFAKRVRWGQKVKS
jgi:hypothetical protein